MKTFFEYIDNKKDERLIETCAALLVERDSFEIVEETFKNFYPKEHRMLAEAGFWDGVNNTWQGIKRGASAMWQGAKAGAAQYKDATSGPQVQYKTAIAALEKLQGQVAQMIPNAVANKSKMPLKDWLAKLVEVLRKQHDFVPELITQTQSQYQQQGQQQTQQQQPQQQPQQAPQPQPQQQPQQAPQPQPQQQPQVQP